MEDHAFLWFEGGPAVDQSAHYESFLMGDEVLDIDTALIQNEVLEESVGLLDDACEVGGEHDRWTEYVYVYA